MVVGRTSTQQTTASCSHPSMLPDCQTLTHSHCLFTDALWCLRETKWPFNKIHLHPNKTHKASDINIFQEDQVEEYGPKAHWTLEQWEMGGRFLLANKSYGSGKMVRFCFAGVVHVPVKGHELLSNILM